MDPVRDLDMLEVSLAERDDFLKVMETLTRIGVASKKTQTLYQSCHILHKKGRYYIAHFKELFKLDGKPTDFSEEDRFRRNTIAKLLQDWGLVTVIVPIDILETVPVSKIKIVSFQMKREWQLVAKYSIGKKF